MRRVNPRLRSRAEEIAASVPKHWLHIPNLDALDTILADHKPKNLIGVYGRIKHDNENYNLYANRVVQKDAKGGYTVWAYDSGLDTYFSRYFKNKTEFTTSLKSDIWAYMSLSGSSMLYWDPKSVLPAPALLREARPLKNPLPGVMLLHARKLNYFYGMVYMARVWDSDKGRYIVWADDSNVFADMATEFRQQHGYPARYDLKFYQHYNPAVDDWLTRRELRRAIPKEVHYGLLE